MEKVVAALEITVYDFLAEAWPYIIVAFIASGLIRELIPSGKFMRVLGGNGFRPIGIAASIGVLFSACSCAVIPLSAGLYRRGAGAGAAIALLVSAPELGIGVILLTWGILGPFLGGQFVIAKILGSVFIALICGIVANLMFRITIHHKYSSREGSEFDFKVGHNSMTSCGHEEHNNHCIKHEHGEHLHKGLDVHARLKCIISTIWEDLTEVLPALLIGFIIAGFFAVLIPPEFVVSALGGRGSFTNILLGLFISPIVGAPAFICNAAAPPLGLTLFELGMNPAAVLAFLLAYPASPPAILVAAKILGKKQAFAYALCVLLSAMVVGLAYYLIFPV
jgi:uncharacterized membrane protein YraQ (UPF0718 family)